MLAIGGHGLAIQVVLMRELMSAHAGNELAAAVVLNAWLGLEALGARLLGALLLAIAALVLYGARRGTAAGRAVAIATSGFAANGMVALGMFAFQVAPGLTRAYLFPAALKLASLLLQPRRRTIGPRQQVVKPQRKRHS